MFPGARRNGGRTLAILIVAPGPGRRFVVSGGRTAHGTRRPWTSPLGARPQATAVITAETPRVMMIVLVTWARIT